MGPLAIFDKSFLQSLNANEAALFDVLFRTNITPVFYLETLADLHKENSRRTPEAEVGIIASKTPSWGSSAYSYNGRYDHPLLSYKTAKRAYDALVALGYAEVAKAGHWDKEKQVGEVTRIIAAPKLQREFDSRFPQRTVFFTRHPNEETIYQKNADRSTQ